MPALSRFRHVSRQVVRIRTGMRHDSFLGSRGAPCRDYQQAGEIRKMASSNLAAGGQADAR